MAVHLVEDRRVSLLVWLDIGLAGEPRDVIRNNIVCSSIEQREHFGEIGYLRDFYIYIWYIIVGCLASWSRPYCSVYVNIAQF